MLAPLIQKPFKIYAVDADTGKPLQPNVGRKTYVTYYDIRKDKNGKKSLVVHKSATASALGKGSGNDEKLGNANGGSKNGGEEKGGEKNGNGNGKAQEKQEGGGDGDGGEKKPNEWTAEEDEKLKALKTADKTWKQIAAELGRNTGHVKGRWKHLNKDGGGADKQQQGGKNDHAVIENGSKDKGEEGSENKQHLSKNEKKASKMHEHAKKTHGPASIKAGSGRGGEQRFTLQEWQTLQEDDLFSFGELQLLSELIMRDQRQTWGRIASAFFDKTGKRVHPDDVREKFQELATSG